MNGGPVEPSAGVRQASKELRGWYMGLTEEGFSPQEALAIIGQILAAHIQNGRTDG